MTAAVLALPDVRSALADVGAEAAEEPPFADVLVERAARPRRGVAPAVAVDEGDVLWRRRRLATIVRTTHARPDVAAHRHPVMIPRPRAEPL